MESPSHIKRIGIDPEKVLKETLLEKFGKRFLKYRADYEKSLKNPDNKYDFLPSYPISVLVGLHNRCDLDCKMCYPGYRNDKKTNLSDKVIKKLFKEFKSNKLSAIMFGANEEPFLYNKLFDVVDMAVSSNIMDIFIFSNGTLLNKKNSDKVLNNEVTRLFISVDAVTRETYDEIRIPNKITDIFNKNRLLALENNIKSFIDNRNKSEMTLPLVRTSMSVQPENKHEVQPFIDKWSGIVDNVEIQVYSDYSSVYRLSKKTKEFNTKSRNLSDNLKNPHCTQPWNTITIWPNGNVSPCCNLNGINLTIGNVNNDTVKNIWNSKEMTTIREQFISGKLNVVCQNCLLSRREDLFEEV
jgi:radical SAM protein with 4Fe4S-binding SPASM domain